jgi:hypothetical protein
MRWQLYGVQRPNYGCLPLELVHKVRTLNERCPLAYEPMGWVYWFLFRAALPWRMTPVVKLVCFATGSIKPANNGGKSAFRKISYQRIVGI